MQFYSVISEKQKVDPDSKGPRWSKESPSVDQYHGVPPYVLAVPRQVIGAAARFDERAIAGDIIRLYIIVPLVRRGDCHWLGQEFNLKSRSPHSARDSG